MRLENKVAIVTGSSQGIGEGIAVRFAAEGARVVINYPVPSQLDKANGVVDEITKAGGKAIAIQADVSKPAECEAMIAETMKQFGQIDILVNNAGVERNAPFLDVTEKDFDFVLGVNLKGSFFCAQAAARAMVDHKTPGRIINISSVHEELPFPHFTPYCASKGGMKMVMRNLSIELAPYGITVNNIAPGAIETPINTALLNDPAKLNALLTNIPLNRLGKPKDVAGVAVFLASEDADYVTGATIFVDGGLTWNYSEQ